jgi:hypothetical protein
VKLLIMKFSPHTCYLVPLRLKYSPEHPILKHPQPSSSLKVSDQVSHPYKTTGKIVVLYILIFKSLDSKLEDKRFINRTILNFNVSVLLLGRYFS